MQEKVFEELWTFRHKGDWRVRAITRSGLADYLDKAIKVP
jgi:hypothetical protein